MFMSFENTWDTSAQKCSAHACSLFLQSQQWAYNYEAKNPVDWSCCLPFKEEKENDVAMIITL